MKAIVIDSESIYVIPIFEGAGTNDVLKAYMKVSGEGWRDNYGSSYTYYVRTHSALHLYSIERELKDVIRHSFNLVINIDIAAWWAAAYPIIEEIANVTGALTGVAAIASAPFVFIKWVRKRANSVGTTSEYKWIKNILNEESWNVALLSEKLSLPEEQTKNLLKGFGYIWDPHKMLFISTENTKKLREQ